MSRAYGVTANDYGKPVIARFSYDDPSLGLLSTVIPVGTPVVCVVKNRDTGTTLINRVPATIVTSTAGVVTLRFDWPATKTATPGRYALTFEAAATGGAVTLPTSGEFIPVTIRADLG